MCPTHRPNIVCQSRKICLELLNSTIQVLIIVLFMGKLVLCHIWTTTKALAQSDENYEL